MSDTINRARRLCALLIAGLAFLVMPAAAQTTPDRRFVLDDEGGFGQTVVDAVRAELQAGLSTLAGLGFAPRTGLFPIRVRLMSGAGISNSFTGVLVLYQIHRNEAPIVHELTHVVAGYDNRLGHWTQEGFASFVQDRYGSNEAFPTFRIPHALARLIADENSLLPMAAILEDRGRKRYFGTNTPWERWVAYVQSTSFVTWLIDTHGIERFRRIYNRAVEDIDFAAVYGKTSDTLIAEWIQFVRSHDGAASRARTIYDRTYAFTHRQMGR